MHDRTPSATTLTDSDRIDRLRLIRSDNIGPRTFRSLLHHFGDARTALDACLTSHDAAARRGRAASAAKNKRALNLPRAKSWASAWSRLVKPATRRGWRRLTMRLPCSACAARWRR
jgi:predicted Rossmann fold nucleotide-binding protein DprA/Smf involved in DNA uptake